jgi:MFS family permease
MRGSNNNVICKNETMRRCNYPINPCGSDSGGQRQALGIDCNNTSIANIDESVINVALPAIETDLATSIITIQWLVNAYALCLSALLLIGGASADQFGRRRFFIVGVSVFAAASLWCGTAPSLTQLISARAAQGVGAALLIPCSLALIGATFDESERGKAIGTWAGSSAVATAIAPLLGGWIVDHFSWRWIFLINPLLAVPTIWIAWALRPANFLNGFGISTLDRSQRYLG